MARQLTDTVDGILLGKRYLILDRDTNYCHAFRHFVKREEIEVIRLPQRSPNLNAYAESIWTRSGPFAVAVECSATQGLAKWHCYIFVYSDCRSGSAQNLHTRGMYVAFKVNTAYQSPSAKRTVGGFSVGLVEIADLASVEFGENTG
jgi:hypothetical protein